MSTIDTDVRDRTIATAWASSGLGLPDEIEPTEYIDPTEYIAAPTVSTAGARVDADRAARRLPLVGFGASCLIVGVAAIGALVFGASGPEPVRVAPGVTGSSISPAPPIAPTEAITPTEPTSAAPAPTVANAPAPPAASQGAQVPAHPQPQVPAPQQPEPAPPADEAPALPPLSDHPQMPEPPLPPLSDHPVPPVADVPDITAVPPAEAPVPPETPDPPKPVSTGPTDLTSGP